MLKFKKIRKKKNEKEIDFFLRAIKGAYATYNMDNTLQCKENCHRTYNDLYRIFQYYYPERMEKDFIRVLKTLIVGGIVNCVYCTDVGEITFFPLLTKRNNIRRYSRIFIVAQNTLCFNSKHLYRDYGGYDIERYPKLKPFLEKFNTQYFK